VIINHIYLVSYIQLKMVAKGVALNFLIILQLVLCLTASQSPPPLIGLDNNGNIVVSAGTQHNVSLEGEAVVFNGQCLLTLVRALTEDLSGFQASLSKLNQSLHSLQQITASAAQSTSTTAMGSTPETTSTLIATTPTTTAITTALEKQQQQQQQ
jgi:hypothetical protein